MLTHEIYNHFVWVFGSIIEYIYPGVIVEESNIWIMKKTTIAIGAIV